MKILIDSNILLRFFFDPSTKEGQKATALIRNIENGKSNGLLSLLVVNEFVWMAERFYHARRQDYCAVLFLLLSCPNVEVLEVFKNDLKQLLDFYVDNRVDLTDCWLFVNQHQADAIASFDEDFRKLKTEKLWTN